MHTLKHFEDHLNTSVGLVYTISRFACFERGAFLFCNAIDLHCLHLIELIHQIDSWRSNEYELPVCRIYVATASEVHDRFSHYKVTLTYYIHENRNGKRRYKFWKKICEMNHAFLRNVNCF